MKAPLPKRPVIAIAVHQGFAIRLLLRTDIFRTLKAAAEKVVILAPNAEEPYFTQEFADDTVVLEQLDYDAYERYRRGSGIQLALELLRLFVLSNRGNLSAIRRRELRERPKVHGLLQWIRWWTIRPLVHLLRRSAVLRRGLMALESRWFAPETHRQVFETHRPDLLIVSSLGYWTHDAYLIREARRHGVPVAAVVLSWDNPSTKGMGGAHPDYAVAWTESMRQELECYHDFPRNRIFVGGIPHFDPHARQDPTPDSDDVLNRLGCVNDRRVLYFATASPTVYHGLNCEVIHALGAAITDGRLEKPSQLIVRIHPLYLGRRNKRGDGSQTEELRALVAKYSHVLLDVPASKSDRIGFDLPEDDSKRLRALLRRADVVITPFSTLMLEAALFDVPVITTGFETFNPALQDTNRAPERFPHLRRVLATGGTRQAHSAGELVEHVNAYLLSRALDSEGRRRLREQECGPNQGRAGEAIGEFLLSVAASPVERRLASGGGRRRGRLGPIASHWLT